MTDKKQLTDAEFEKLLHGMGNGGREVDTSWPDPVNWDNDPVLNGTVVEVETCKLPDRTTRRASVDTGKGVVSLWESASLQKLFDSLAPNSVILVAYTGMKTLPGGREQRQFRVAHKPAKG